jgi:hypothetical protein
VQTTAYPFRGTDFGERHDEMCGIDDEGRRVPDLSGSLVSGLMFGVQTGVGVLVAWWSLRDRDGESP